MFGIADASIWLVYFLCIASALLCVVYGLKNWNKGNESENLEVQEESKWESGDQT